MGKKSRQKAKVERAKQKKAAAGAAGGSREVDSVELAERDPAAAGRFIAETLLEVGADLDSPYAHFIASTWPHFANQTSAYDSLMTLRGHPHMTSDLRAIVAGEWSKLSDAEKAVFTSPLLSSFPAAARVRVTTDEASSSSTATAAADEKRDATVGAAASTSAAADRAPPELEPDDDGTAYNVKLRLFINSIMAGLILDMQSWVQSEYGGDLRRLRADADRGDAKAQFAFACTIKEHGGNVDDILAWITKSAKRGYGDAVVAIAMMSVATNAGPCALTEVAITALRHIITLTGSADAQHIMGLIESIRQSPTADKDDFLETARWFRAAAHQGLKEAQWELGEMFRKGVFCDVHMFFARQYIKRAARQGHAEAMQRVKELCRCVYCGAERAPWKCSTCLETRYCDSACSTAHWRRGGGVSEVCESALPHRKTCPRTYDDPCDT